MIDSQRDGVRELDLMAAAVAAGLLLSLSFHFVKAVCFDLNVYPHNTFLFMPADRFNDFVNIYKSTRKFNPFASAVSVYPPFAYVVMLPFTLVGKRIALGLMLAGFTSFVWGYVRQAINGIVAVSSRLKTFSLAFLSYPFLFVFDRANIEAIVFIFLALFVRAYQKEKSRYSVLFLACAMAMKIYPGAFLLIFIKDRRFKDAVYTLLAVAGLTLFGMAILKGGVLASYHGFINNMAGFRAAYFFTDSGLQHNASLFGAMRLFYGYFLPGAQIPELPYSMAMAAFAILTFYYVVFVSKELWRSVLSIVSYIIVAPQVSFDYKLIHLLIPITLFLQRDRFARSDKWFVLLFILLLIPKDYLLLRGDISVSVLLNPAIILAAVCMLFYQGISGKFFRPGIAGEGG